MSNQDKIFWISSYPKSGNTWMRSIIASLFFSEDGNFKFELFKKISSFEKHKFYNFVKEKNDKDFNELQKTEIISKYWIEAQKNMSIDGGAVFLKTHNANISVNNHEFTNSDLSMGLIYLIRNPLDVCVSYSNHLGINIDETINFMISDKTLTFFEDPKKNRYPVPLGRWDNHINSWKKLNVPKLLIKYEDLLLNTESILKKIINFFEKDLNIMIQNKEIKLKNVKKTTKFEFMKDYKKKYGFDEAQKNVVFFRSAQKDEWKKILNNNQKDIIINEFGLVMKDYNYI